MKNELLSWQVLFFGIFLGIATSYVANYMYERAHPESLFEDIRDYLSGKGATK